jgi:Tol biopolymer transport system component
MNVKSKLYWLGVVTAAWAPAGCGSPTGPTQPEAESTPILFTHLGAEGWDIYSMRMDGTGLVRLTTGGADDLYPVWFDHHHRVAFQSSRDGGWIFAMQPGGSAVELLYRNTPSYNNSNRFGISPDGKRVVFTPRLSNELRVATVPDSTSSLLAFGNQPGWSPDGARLAFTSPEGLGVVRIDGSGLGTLLASVGASEPAWSSDGRRIAYSEYVGAAGDVLFVANVDGSNAQQLTNPGSNTFVFDRGATWAPDGRFLAFQREYICRQGTTCYDIMVVPAGGGPLLNLTAGLGEDRVSVRPSW